MRMQFDDFSDESDVTTAIVAPIAVYSLFLIQDFSLFLNPFEWLGLLFTRIWVMLNIYLINDLIHLASGNYKRLPNFPMPVACRSRDQTTENKPGSDFNFLI
jgi:hypothetical protein